MKTIKQVAQVMAYNFRYWRRNPRIIIVFGLTFVLSFLLSDKAVQFASEHSSSMQIGEAFIWTFGDSGKTVLMKCICGFLVPSKGKILVSGLQVGRDMDFPDDTGIIIETPGFLPNLSGIKNLELLANLRRRISREEIRQAMARLKCGS